MSNHYSTIKNTFFAFRIVFRFHKSLWFWLSFDRITRKQRKLFRIQDSYRVNLIVAHHLPILWHIDATTLATGRLSSIMTDLILWSINLTLRTRCFFRYSKTSPYLRSYDDKILVGSSHTFWSWNKRPWSTDSGNSNFWRIKTSVSWTNWVGGS